jgi:hypothetical protein
LQLLNHLADPPNGTSIEKQSQAAINAPFQLSPGQPWPVEGASPGSETVTAVPTPSASASAAPAVEHAHHLSGGAIAGIVIGSIAVLALAAALFYFVGRSNSYKDIIKRSEAGGAASSTGGDNNIGPWSPAAQSPTPNLSAGAVPWDNRFSGQTAYSQVISRPEGAFIGYNRQTGAPEFAAEAPMAEKSQKEAPAAHPATEPQSNQETTYELPGETPPVAEVGPYR